MTKTKRTTERRFIANPPSPDHLTRLDFTSFGLGFGTNSVDLLNRENADNSIASHSGMGSFHNHIRYDISFRFWCKNFYSGVRDQPVFAEKIFIFAIPAYLGDRQSFDTNFLKLFLHLSQSPGWSIPRKQLSAERAPTLLMSQPR